MKVQWQGRTWEFGLDDINLKQAMVIQSHTGLSINKFADALNDEADEQGNVITPAVEKPEFLQCLGAMYWLMLQQNGEIVPIGEVDFPIGAFSEAVGNAVAEEALARLAEEAAKAERAPDPTRPLPGSEPSAEPPSPNPESMGDGRISDG